MAPLDSPPDVRTVLVPAAADIHARTASLATPAGSVPCKMQGACLSMGHAITIHFSELWSGHTLCIFEHAIITSHQLQQVVQHFSSSVMGLGDG